MSGRLENSKARNIRLVGLDLDGTVFTDEKTITPATKDAIARAVRAGVAVSYTHLRAHETGRNLVCRLLLEKKKNKKKNEAS